MLNAFGCVSLLYKSPALPRMKMPAAVTTFSQYHAEEFDFRTAPLVITTPSLTIKSNNKILINLTKTPNIPAAHLIVLGASGYDSGVNFNFCILAMGLF